MLPWLPTLSAPALIDERVLVFEARKWLGLDMMAPWHLPLGGSGSWRPLLVYAFWLDAGWHDAARHAVNLALHAGLVAVAHAWLRRRLAPSAACLAACFFAVHISHAATAGWIGGRADLLMALCAAGALLAWEEERWLLTAALAGTGILFKETGVVVLPMLVILRADRRLLAPAATVGLAFALSWWRAIPEPGYLPDLAAWSAASQLWAPFALELTVPWFMPVGVPEVTRDLVGLVAAVPVAATLVLLGWPQPEWRRGVALAAVALPPVLHVLPNDGGQWYLLLPSLGAALALGAVAGAERRSWRLAMAIVGITAALACWEAMAWRTAAARVQGTIEAVIAGTEEAPRRQDPRNWPHRGPSFCCGVPYQVLEDPDRGWGPIVEPTRASPRRDSDPE